MDSTLTDIGMRGLDMIEQLAIKAGATVETFWPVLVAQQKLDSIACLAVLTVLICLIALGGWILNRSSCTQDYDGIIVIVTFIAACLTVIVIFITAKPILVGFFNPEYGAAMDLIKMVKP